MLVIRLARTGRTKYPTYRLVAADSARTATGRFVAQLGHYNPHTKELVVNHELTERYLSTGAQPSNTAIKLLQRDGVELPQWVKLKTKAPKVDPEAAAIAAAEAAPAEDSANTDAPEAEAPVVEDEQRVAMVAEDAAAATSDETVATATQETAASDEAQAEALADASDAAATVATEPEAKES